MSASQKEESKGKDQKPALRVSQGWKWWITSDFFKFLLPASFIIHFTDFYFSHTVDNFLIFITLKMRLFTMNFLILVFSYIMTFCTHYFILICKKKKAKLKWLKLWSGKFWNPPFPEHVTNSFDTLIYKTRDRQTHNLLRTNRDMFIATRRVSRINHRQETADHKSSS